MTYYDSWEGTVRLLIFTSHIIFKKYAPYVKHFLYKYPTEASTTCVHISSLIMLQTISILFRFFAICIYFKEELFTFWIQLSKLIYS